MVLLAVVICLSLLGCSRKPSGIYLSQPGASEERLCLDFRTDGKVVIKDLSSPLVDESEYTTRNGVVTVKLFGFFGVLLALPAAAVIMVLLRHAHEQYLSSHLYGAPPPE